MKNNYYYRLYFFKSDVKVLILLELTESFFPSIIVICVQV